VQRFRNNGYEVKDPNQCVRKKNNYKDLASTSWKDSHLMVQEKRHTNTDEGKFH